MSKELVISATPHETRVAILEEGQLCEIYIEREKEFALVGSIYKGRVTRVLPGMQSAFVEIGLDSDAFLYVSDFLEHVEEYDQIVTTVEGKVEKMEQEGGRVFAGPADGRGAPTEPPEVLAGEGESSPEGSAPGDDAPPAEDPSSPPAIAPPSPPPPQRFESRDRGPRGGFGRDRGRGRPGRGGPRGRGDARRSGRDLPPSKYASHRPYEPRPYEPPAADGERVILPGESLAKYKDRPLAPPPAPLESQVTPPVATELPPWAPPAAGAQAASGDRVVFSYPGNIEVAEAPAAAQRESLIPASEPALPEGSFAAPEPAAAPANAEPPPAPLAPCAEETSGRATEEEATSTEAHPEITDEEAIFLSEHVVEAQHEEAYAAEESAAPRAEEHGEEIEAAEGDSDLADDNQIRQEIFDSMNDGAALEAAAEDAGAARADEPGQEDQRGSEDQPQASSRVEENARARFQRPMRRGARRGGRPHGRPHPRASAAGGQRRPQLISEMLKASQEIIVQIAKEPLGKKGARITSHVALPGRFLVYMPTVDHIGVSRKIASAEDRSRLRRLLTEMKGSFPGGFIVRTAAGGASDEEIRSDVEFLGKTWAEIRARAEQRRAPAILHRDLDLIERILRDHLSPDFTSIWIDNEEEFTKIVEFVNRFQPLLVNRVKLYTKPTPIFEEMGIQQDIDKSLRPKVWLKSGGYIVINHTEAMVAIDVNTGKFVGKGSTRLEDTIVKTNVEAVKEIVRQIRLRDLGGIIVVDFIDMEERKNRMRVMQALDEALRADKAPSKVLAFNEFGLVAITRKRTKQSLERVLCQPCPYCTGSGMVKSVPTICYEIQSEARKMAKELDAASLTLRVNPEIAKALKTRESALVEELEQWTRKSIIIQSDPTLHWEQYDIF